MEFLISYGWAFLLIAIIVGVLVYYVVLPRNITPNTCSFVTGIICNDMSVNVNSVTKLITIYVNMTNNEPNNVANAVLFVNLGGVNSTPVKCITNGTIAPGGLILCSANTVIKGSVSQFYSGSVYLNVSDCGLLVNYTYSHSCNNAPQQTIRGVFSGHGEAVVPSVFQTQTALGYLYCVGSTLTPGNQVYYAPILPNNAVGQWASTTPYPVSNMQYAGCSFVAAGLGFIFCVGGAGSSNSVYFAIANSVGVGAWTKTTSYPIALTSAGCAFSGTYLECVGTNSSGLSNSVYYGHTNAAGITGGWVASTAYPISFYNSGCFVYSNIIYCIGGQANPYAIYSTSVSSGVFGAWQQSGTTTNGIVNSGCAAFNGYVYCVGGSLNPNAAYYASLSGNTVGTWTGTTQYPTAFTNAGCTAAAGYLYCIGSSSSKATLTFYAPITANGIGAWKAGNQYPVPLANAYCASSTGSTGGYLS